jgi:[acyl-carrier-protein] S-malonyltransferase
MPLAVSAPFHSSLLRPAAERLRSRLADIPVARPAIAVINNVDVRAETEPDAIRDALARQAAQPVRWSETIRSMAAMGVTHVVECGPGKVLTGLTRRIDGALVGLSIGDRASLDAALEALK